MSRKYSKVERFVWRDPEYRSLDMIAQHTWLHLLTSPLLTSIPGLIPASLTTIADEMGLVLSEEFRNSFESLVALGWVKVDTVARLIFLPGAVKHNPPESPNVIKGWGSSFREIPDSQLKYEWLQVFINFCNDEPGEKFNRPEAVSKAFTKDIETLSKRLRNPFETLSKPINKPFRTPEPSPEPKPSPEPEQETEVKIEQKELELDRPEADRSRSLNGFDLFWSAYPRKIAKAAARKAWEKTKGSRPELNTLLVALATQKCSAAWTRDGGQFIPHPATWLNAGRWDDEVQVGGVPTSETPSQRAWREQREQAARWLHEAEEKEAQDAERENTSADNHHLLGGVREVQDDRPPTEHLDDDDGRHTG